uniref:Uncharacterized protein n=1 Tax=Trichuris muris TaxID=70415 RepID=A0A5S6Q7W1_TRIMR
MTPIFTRFTNGQQMYMVSLRLSRVTIGRAKDCFAKASVAINPRTRSRSKLNRFNISTGEPLIHFEASFPVLNGV